VASEECGKRVPEIDRWDSTSLPAISGFSQNALYLLVFFIVQTRRRVVHLYLPTPLSDHYSTKEGLKAGREKTQQPFLTVSQNGTRSFRPSGLVLLWGEKAGSPQRRMKGTGEGPLTPLHDIS